MLYEVTVNGETRKVVANFSRNGFFYTLDRASGQFIRGDQYQEKVTWTKGLDPKTGRPVDYNPDTPVQVYAGTGAMRGKAAQTDCPWWGGAPTFFPPTFDQKRMIAYVAGAEGCVTGTAEKNPLDENKDYVGRPPCCSQGGKAAAHGAIWALDVRTGKVITRAQFPAPDESGMLGTDGDLVFSGHPDGKLVAYDADSLKELWSFSLGMPITAPPMSYSVGGKQYVAVVVGGATSIRGAGLRQPGAIVAVFGR
jgi:alcohol dehydrogenase (cytochrome c)